MKIAVASDHAGFDLKELIRNYLSEKGVQVLDFGAFSSESVDYPDYAFPASESVANRESDFGILVCGTGLGMSITANKVNGIRAVDCVNTEMAEMARKHNNANVLTLGARLLSPETAYGIIDKFLETEFDGGRHQNRIDKIHNLTGI